MGIMEMDNSIVQMNCLTNGDLGRL
jgi:hypothetical protein